MALGIPQLAIADNVYSIYPIPQEQVAVTGNASISSKVNLVVEAGIDDVTRKRATDILTQNGIQVVISDKEDASMSNIYLGINGSKGAGDALATSLQLKRDVFTQANKFDRHCVSLTSRNGQAQILVLGENTDATFYGLASLEQMLDYDHKALPCVTIYDYADQKSRGIVEGYYGYPYTVEVKKDLMRYMMRYKMNTYMYGAKSDPYHSQYWKKPYPTNLTAEQAKNGWLSQDMVKDITKVSHDTKVNFIWAIHPGNDIINSNSVVSDVTSKFDMMYKLGVRQFAVFVDDVSIPSSDADMATNARNITSIQQALEKKYNENYTAAADTVKPLHLVPQVYCTAFAGDDQRKRFFKALSDIPSQVTVYTTGWGVWSVPNQGDFNTIAREFGRPGAWWWNYPCNDNADAQIYPMDMYSNFYDMPAVDNNARLPKELNNSLGIVCNPMQQGEVSKIPLFSTADYAWNASGFNHLKSWEAAFPAIVGKEKAASLQLLAKYLRWNDPTELNSLINKFKNGLSHGNPNISDLKQTLDDVYAACIDIEALKQSERESDRLLYNDLAPWLLKLKQMVASSNALLQVAAMDKEEEGKWDRFVHEIDQVDSLDLKEEYKAYALEGMGNGISVSVRPAAPSQKYLYDFTKYLKENALGDFFPETETKPYLVSNMENSRGRVVISKDLVTFANCTNVLQPGEYIGMALPHPTLLGDFNVADTLLANNTLLYSSNGKAWTNFTDKETLLQGYVKYICIKNTGDAPKKISLSRTVISAQMPAPTQLASVDIPEGPIWDNHQAKFLIDGDYNTFVCLHRCQYNGDKYTVKLKEPTAIHDVRICMGTVNGDHMNIGNVEISKDGKSWKKIRVKGTNTYNFTMNLPQVVKYSNEMSYCDFQAAGEEAAYVRFNVTGARTDKWLRFYELEVNRQSDKQKEQTDCVDQEGNNVEALSDRRGDTGMEQGTPSIVCHFNDIQFLKAVEIYQNAEKSAAAPASVQITADGEHWTDYGKLTLNKQVIDLSQQKEATAMRIVWEGKQAPAIYEIVAVCDKEESAEVTKIEPIATTEGMLQVDFKGNSVWVESATGIRNVTAYSFDGKQLLRYEAAGQCRVLVPDFTRNSSPYLLRVVLSDGSKASYKVLR